MGRLLVVVAGFIIYGVFKAICCLFEMINNKINEPERKRLANLRQKEQERLNNQRSERYRKEQEEQIKLRAIQEEQKNQRDEIARKEEEEREKKLWKEEEEREKKLGAFIEHYKNFTSEQILLDGTLSNSEKILLLSKIHNYHQSDAEELIKTAERAKKNARLNAIKRKVAQKAQELYGDIPSDDNRKAISDEVKMFVWQRDAGKCVKCGSNQSLEFDHIIPIAKGGSNSERNIQLLCEQCNRSKSDNIS